MSQTKLLVGVDEAGYGPSMGPLTICATAWRVPSCLDAEGMTALLEPEFQARPFKPNSTHVPMGDSKKIHQGKLAEEGLVLGSRFLCFAVDGTVPTDWDSQIASFAKIDRDRLAQVPWYAAPLPLHSVRLDQCIEDQPVYFGAAICKLKKSCIELAGIRMRVIDEIEFNRQVDRLGNKSTLLSELSLELVRTVVTELSNQDEQIEVYCDKHGGRNRYQAFLAFAFGEWFDFESEGRDCSRYKSKWAGHEMKIQFKVDGDSMFPSAAASVIAKCTREELVARLNRFWQAKVPGVAPTAGYYVDALRFAKAIDQTATKTGLHRDQWWRKK